MRPPSEIAHFLTRKVEKGQLAPDDRDAAVARLTTTTELEALADCDLVIEAIVEALEPKRALFAELDRICRPDTILATNTSALSVAEIAAATTRPSASSACTSSTRRRLMPLVEIVQAELTVGRDGRGRCGRRRTPRQGRSCAATTPRGSSSIAS